MNKTRKILIPIDSSSPDLKVMHFQHNGIDCFVPLGKVTKVPDWVIEKNPAVAEYEVK